MPPLEPPLSQLLRGDNSLLDTRLDEIRITVDADHRPQLLLTFSGFRRCSAFKRVRLHFSDVIEYLFLHQENYAFYVEDLKLIESEETIYLSLDPAPGTSERSNQDNDFVLARHVELLDLSNDEES